MKKQFLSISFIFIYALAMFKPVLPYVVFYTQKFACEVSMIQSVEELEEARVGAYVGSNGRNYLSALKKRMDPLSKDTHKPQVPVTSNDIPTFTYNSFSFLPKAVSIKDFLTTPHYSKHFVISEYSFSIFHPPKYAA